MIKCILDDGFLELAFHPDLQIKNYMNTQLPELITYLVKVAGAVLPQLEFEIPFLSSQISLDFDQIP